MSNEKQVYKFHLTSEIFDYTLTHKELSMTRHGNCLVLIIAIVLIIWLTAWGGCQLVKKKTQEALQDTTAPVPAAPQHATPEKPGK